MQGVAEARCRLKTFDKRRARAAESEKINMDHRVYWIWLAENIGYGSTLAVKLVNVFGNAANVYAATPEDLDVIDTKGLSTREISAVKRVLAEKNLEEAEKILRKAEQLGQRVIVPTDADFPKSLFALRNAPLVLYVVGTLPKLNRELCVSVVGTRKMSDSGRRNAFAMGYGLAAGGAVVVSGMALGCDGAALCGAIEAGGKTVAVLGGGADVVYPKDHLTLYNTIIKNGAVISEYPPETETRGHHFPVRNRIISGLSAGSVIVEGDMKSGALITARHAINQGRNVFAVPGDVSLAVSEGPNELLKTGAFVTTGAEDVLGEYEFLYPRQISLRVCHRALRDLDIDAASEESILKLRISSRGGNKFYGSGAYGGKKYAVETTVKKKQKSSVKRADRKNAAKSVAMGELAADGIVKVLPKPVSPVASEAPVKAEKLVERENRIELDLLDELNIKVYNMMKPDVPMIADELVNSEVSVSDVLSSLSMLELAGAVESYPGGYFLRISQEELVFDPSEA